jgi:hypothetical protein
MSSVPLVLSIFGNKAFVFVAKDHFFELGKTLLPEMTVHLSELAMKAYASRKEDSCSQIITLTIGLNRESRFLLTSNLLVQVL